MWPQDQEKKNTKVYDLNIARQKIEAFCAYQERSHKQVQDKLKTFGLRTDVADEIISELIQHNFLNESRFAQAFVSGKFRIKKWGRQKIKQHLKNHRVSDYNIKKALATIDQKEYTATFFSKAEKRWTSLKTEHSTQKKQKFIRFMYSHGFENELIFEFLKDQS